MKKWLIFALVVGSTLQAANFKVTQRTQGGNKNKLITVTALQDGIVLNDAKVNRGNCKSTFGLQKAMYLELTKTGPKVTKISLTYPKKPYPKTAQELADHLPKMLKQENKMSYGTELMLIETDEKIADLERQKERSGLDDGDEKMLQKLQEDRSKFFKAYENLFRPVEKKVAELMEEAIRSSKAERFADAVRGIDISNWQEYFAAHPEQIKNLKMLSYNWDDYIFYTNYRVCELENWCKTQISESDTKRFNAMDLEKIAEMNIIIEAITEETVLGKNADDIASIKDKNNIATKIDKWQNGFGGIRNRYYGIETRVISDIASELDTNLKKWIESESKFKEHSKKGIKFQENPNSTYGVGESHIYLYPHIALTDAYVEIVQKVDPKAQAKQPTGIKLNYGQSFEFGVDFRCQILDVQLNSNKGVETFKF